MADNPLRQAPLWVAVIITVLAGLATPLSCLTIRTARALVMGVGLALAYAVLAQVAFQEGLILPLSYPLVALAIGTLGALLVSYLGRDLGTGALGPLRGGARGHGPRTDRRAVRPPRSS